jgi:glycosyltransferase involved in cell wall biosynthesis
MRILYLVDQFPGLFEVYLFREIGWMRSHGHSVAVVSLGSVSPHGFRTETGTYVDLAEFGVNDIPVLQLDIRQTPQERIIAEALAFAREHSSEIIDAHVAREPAEVACDMHLASGLPFAVRMRGGDVHTRTSLRLAEIVEHASAVCPLSQFLAGVLTGSQVSINKPQRVPLKIDSDKLHIIPTGLPMQYLADTAADQRDDVQIIGAIGRVVPVKRFQDVIEAVAHLAKDFPGLKFRIIGGGSLAPELQALAEKHGIEDRFEITGFKSWREVIYLARQLHIYVQSSELEGCSSATVEAGFQGLPLVLSRCGANEQCVKPGINGELFDPGDVTTLQKRLQSVLEAGAAGRKKMGAASLEIVGQRFRDENIMPGIERVYQSAITRQMMPAAQVTALASRPGDTF